MAYRGILKNCVESTSDSAGFTDAPVYSTSSYAGTPAYGLPPYDMHSSYTSTPPYTSTNPLYQLNHPFGASDNINIQGSSQQGYANQNIPAGNSDSFYNPPSTKPVSNFNTQLLAQALAEKSKLGLLSDPSDSSRPSAALAALQSYSDDGYYDSPSTKLSVSSQQSYHSDYVLPASQESSSKQFVNSFTEIKKTLPKVYPSLSSNDAKSSIRESEHSETDEDVTASFPSLENIEDEDNWLYGDSVVPPKNDEHGCGAEPESDQKKDSSYVDLTDDNSFLQQQCSFTPLASTDCEKIFQEKETRMPQVSFKKQISVNLKRPQHVSKEHSEWEELDEAQDSKKERSKSFSKEFLGKTQLVDQKINLHLSARKQAIDQSSVSSKQSEYQRYVGNHPVKDDGKNSTVPEDEVQLIDIFTADHESSSGKIADKSDIVSSKVTSSRGPDPPPNDVLQSLKLVPNQLQKKGQDMKSNRRLLSKPLVVLEKKKLARNRELFASDDDDDDDTAMKPAFGTKKPDLKKDSPFDKKREQLSLVDKESSDKKIKQEFPKTKKGGLDSPSEYSKPKTDAEKLSSREVHKHHRSKSPVVYSKFQKHSSSPPKQSYRYHGNEYSRSHRPKTSWYKNYEGGSKGHSHEMNEIEGLHKRRRHHSRSPPSSYHNQSPGYREVYRSRRLGSHSPSPGSERRVRRDSHRYSPDGPPHKTRRMVHDDNDSSNSSPYSQRSSSERSKYESSEHRVKPDLKCKWSKTDLRNKLITNKTKDSNSSLKDCDLSSKTVSKHVKKEKVQFSTVHGVKSESNTGDTELENISSPEGDDFKEANVGEVDKVKSENSTAEESKPTVRKVEDVAEFFRRLEAHKALSAASAVQIVGPAPKSSLTSPNAQNISSIGASSQLQESSKDINNPTSSASMSIQPCTMPQPSYAPSYSYGSQSVPMYSASSMPYGNMSIPPPYQTNAVPYNPYVMPPLPATQYYPPAPYYMPPVSHRETSNYGAATTPETTPAQQDLTISPFKSLKKSTPSRVRSLKEIPVMGSGIKNIEENIKMEESPAESSKSDQTVTSVEEPETGELAEAPSPGPSNVQWNMNDYKKEIGRKTEICTIIHDLRTKYSKLKGMDDENKKQPGHGKEQIKEAMQEKQKELDWYLTKLENVNAKLAKMKDHINSKIHADKPVVMKEQIKSKPLPEKPVVMKEQIKSKPLPEKHAVMKEQIKSKEKPVKPAETIKEKDEVGVRYFFYDAGAHWCQLCNELFTTINLKLDHLMSPQHKQHMDPFEKGWVPPPAKEDLPSRKTNIIKKRQAVKGSEFIMPVEGFYCTICKEAFQDNQYTEHHLKSLSHFENYKKYVEENKDYENKFKQSMLAGVSVLESEKKRKAHEEVKSAVAAFKRSKVKSAETPSTKTNADSKPGTEKLNVKPVFLHLSGKKDKPLEKNVLLKPSFPYIGKAPHYRIRAAGKTSNKSGLSNKESDAKKNIENKAEGIERSVKQSADSFGHKQSVENIFYGPKTMSEADQAQKKEANKEESVKTLSSGGESVTNKPPAVHSEEVLPASNLVSGDSSKAAKMRVDPSKLCGTLPNQPANSAAKQATPASEDKNKLTNKGNTDIPLCDIQLPEMKITKQEVSSKAENQPVQTPVSVVKKKSLTEEEQDFLLLGINKDDMKPLVTPKPPPDPSTQRSSPKVLLSATSSSSTTASAATISQQNSTSTQNDKGKVFTGVAEVPMELSPTQNHAIVVETLPPFPPPLQVPPPNMIMQQSISQQRPMYDSAFPPIYSSFQQMPQYSHVVNYSNPLLPAQMFRAQGPMLSPHPVTNVHGMIPPRTQSFPYPSPAQPNHPSYSFAGMSANVYHTTVNSNPTSNSSNYSLQQASTFQATIRSLTPKPSPSETRVVIPKQGKASENVDSSCTPSTVSTLKAKGEESQTASKTSVSAGIEHSKSIQDLATAKNKPESSSVISAVGDVVIENNAVISTPKQEAVSECVEPTHKPSAVSETPIAEVEESCQTVSEASVSAGVEHSKGVSNVAFIESKPETSSVIPVAGGTDSSCRIENDAVISTSKQEAVSECVHPTPEPSTVLETPIAEKAESYQTVSEASVSAGVEHSRGASNVAFIESKPEPSSVIPVTDNTDSSCRIENGAVISTPKQESVSECVHPTPEPSTLLQTPIAELGESCQTVSEASVSAGVEHSRGASNVAFIESKPEPSSVTPVAGGTDSSCRIENDAVISIPKQEVVSECVHPPPEPSTVSATPIAEKAESYQSVSKASVSAEVERSESVSDLVSTVSELDSPSTVSAISDAGSFAVNENSALTFTPKQETVSSGGIDSTCKPDTTIPSSMVLVNPQATVESCQTAVTVEVNYLTSIGDIPMEIEPGSSSIVAVADSADSSCGIENGAVISTPKQEAVSECVHPSPEPSTLLAIPIAEKAESYLSVSKASVSAEVKRSESVSDSVSIVSKPDSSSIVSEISGADSFPVNENSALTFTPKQETVSLGSIDSTCKPDTTSSLTMVLINPQAAVESCQTAVNVEVNYLASISDIPMEVEPESSSIVAAADGADSSCRIENGAVISTQKQEALSECVHPTHEPCTVLATPITEKGESYQSVSKASVSAEVEHSESVSDSVSTVNKPESSSIVSAISGVDSFLVNENSALILTPKQETFFSENIDSTCKPDTTILSSMVLVNPQAAAESCQMAVNVEVKHSGSVSDIAMEIEPESSSVVSAADDATSSCRIENDAVISTPKQEVVSESAYPSPEYNTVLASRNAEGSESSQIANVEHSKSVRDLASAESKPESSSKVNVTSNADSLPVIENDAITFTPKQETESIDLTCNHHSMNPLSLVLVNPEAEVKAHQTTNQALMEVEIEQLESVSDPAYVGSESETSHRVYADSSSHVTVCTEVADIREYPSVSSLTREESSSSLEHAARDNAITTKTLDAINVNANTLDSEAINEVPLDLSTDVRESTCVLGNKVSKPEVDDIQVVSEDRGEKSAVDEKSVVVQSSVFPVPSTASSQNDSKSFTFREPASTENKISDQQTNLGQSSTDCISIDSNSPSKDEQSKCEAKFDSREHLSHVEDHERTDITDQKLALQNQHASTRLHFQKDARHVKEDEQKNLKAMAVAELDSEVRDEAVVLEPVGLVTKLKIIQDTLEPIVEEQVKVTDEVEGNTSVGFVNNKNSDMPADLTEISKVESQGNEGNDKEIAAFSNELSSGHKPVSELQSDHEVIKPSDENDSKKNIEDGATAIDLSVSDVKEQALAVKVGAIAEEEKIEDTEMEEQEDGTVLPVEENEEKKLGTNATVTKNAKKKQAKRKKSTVAPRQSQRIKKQQSANSSAKQSAEEMDEDTDEYDCED